MTLTGFSSSSLLSSKTITSSFMLLFTALLSRYADVVVLFPLAGVFLFVFVVFGEVEVEVETEVIEDNP